MDAFVLSRLAREIEARWGGAWVQGAWVDLAGRVVLQLRAPGRSGFLVLSPAGPAPGVGVLPRRPPVPSRPPAVAAYVRAHGVGGRLRGARCTAFDRVLEVRLRRGAEGVGLVLDLSARRGAVLVLDGEGRVVLAHRPGPGRGPAGAGIGRPYRPPPVPEGRVRAPEAPGILPEALAGEEPLQRRVVGLGTHTAREAERRVRAAPEPAGAWGELLAEVDRPGSLWVYPDVLSAVELAHRPGEGERRADALEAAGEWMEARLRSRDREETERDRVRAEAEHRRRLERRIARIRTDLERLPDPGRLRALADALAASLHAVERGARRVVVPDPQRSGVEVEVPLDPGLSPSENLDLLYRRARKAERAREALAERLEASLRELEAGPSPREPGRARDALAGSGSGPFGRYRSSDGWPIWVGRNGRENDRLLREARPWDLWLHARDAPGAHVLVRKPGREARCPERTLLEAAGLAALHSRKAADGAVEVMVLEAGRVRKPKGASPGRVLVAGERTVRVRPGWGNPRPWGGGG